MHIHFRITATCLLASAVAILSGCALLFTEGETEIGIIPCVPRTNFVFRTTLPRDAHAITFCCALPAPKFPDENMVVVTLTNTSSSGVIELPNPGAFTTVVPHSGALLYAGSLPRLLERQSFPVSMFQNDGRVPCELHIQFSSALTLPMPIKILYQHSSPPL